MSRDELKKRLRARGMRTVCFLLSLLLFLPGLLMGCAGRSVTPQEKQMARMVELAEKQQEEKVQKERVQPNHLELARELVKKGLFKVALVQLEQARRSGGDSCEVFHLMGRCHLGLGEGEQAAASFRRALALDGRYAPAHNGLGLALDLSGSREPAWQSYGKAIEINPAIPDFHNNLGFSKLLAGRTDEAEHHLREALALNPRLRTAAHNLALCHALQGRYDRAADLLKEHDTAAAAANNLGVLYDLSGDRESAVQHYTAALNMDQTLRAAAQNLGYVRAGSSDEVSGPTMVEMAMEEP